MQCMDLCTHYVGWLGLGTGGDLLKLKVVWLESSSVLLASTMGWRISSWMQGCAMACRW